MTYWCHRGKEGDELEDVEIENDFHFNEHLRRRRSNSNGGSSIERPWDGRTKFEEVEEVFDEED